MTYNDYRTPAQCSSSLDLVLYLLLELWWVFTQLEALMGATESEFQLQKLLQSQQQWVHSERVEKS